MIAVDVFVAAVVLAVIGGLFVTATNRRQERAVMAQVTAHSPLYRTTRRMASVLDSLLIQDANFPILSDKQRSSIEECLREWENLL